MSCARILPRSSANCIGRSRLPTLLQTAWTQVVVMGWVSAVHFEPPE